MNSLTRTLLGGIAAAALLAACNSTGTLSLSPPGSTPAAATPTPAQTAPPTGSPTNPPTQPPTAPPTGTPTSPSTSAPTDTPTAPPTGTPTQPATSAPTDTPTAPPTTSPTNSPTSGPTIAPTTPPTIAPTVPPTTGPTTTPTGAPAGSAWVGTFDSFPGAAWSTQWGLASPPGSDTSNDGGKARSPASYGTDCQYNYCVPNGGTTPTLHLATETHNGHAVLQADYAASSSAFSCSCARGGGQFYMHLVDTRQTDDLGQSIGNAAGVGRMDLASAPTIHMRYYLKFPVGHSWGTGAKLPGLYAGTEGAESGFVHQGSAFSTRYMERGGSGEVYLYTSCAGGSGQDISFSGPSFSADGNWHYIEQAVTRTGGGSVQVWLDGVQVLAPHSFGCPAIATQNFGGVFFSTFYGGHASSWGPSKKDMTEFADFAIDTKMIGP